MVVGAKLTMDIGVTPESKALRLARYLREFVKLRTTTVQDVDKYEAVLWFADMPNESECQSPAWNDGLEPLLRDASPILVSDVSQGPNIGSNTSKDFFGRYVTYNGPAEPDPRTVNAGVVADGLFRIIDCEGPMIAKRAYDIYLRGCGIRRLGGELKSTMNKALTVAITGFSPRLDGAMFSQSYIKDRQWVLREKGIARFGARTRA